MVERRTILRVVETRRMMERRAVGVESQKNPPTSRDDSLEVGGRGVKPSYES
jgi:hypothetical protein